MSLLRDRLRAAMARRADLAAPGERVTQAALARHVGIRAPSVADWFSGETQSIEGANLVKAAEYLRVNPKWLATGKGPQAVQEATAHLSKVVGVSPDETQTLHIERFDTGGSMGGGLVLKDQPGVIESWRVSPEWIQKNVRHYSAIKNLCIVTGFGDSMRPMFNPGDPLLVDVGVRTVEYDAVYFFRVENEGFIKRLQRIPGEGIRVLSANRDNYEPWTVKKGMDFEVFGRVLKVWCSEDL